jgi:hypothetical protein
MFGEPTKTQIYIFSVDIELHETSVDIYDLEDPDLPPP